jgi:L-asparaginase II
MKPILCEFRRGGRPESLHRVRAAVVVDGDLAGDWGDVKTPVFLRSCAKPFQALAALESGGLDAVGASVPELAVVAGSHPGERVHVEAAASLLRKARIPAAALRCGTHPPSGNGALRELHRKGKEPSVLHNNCSGKHAGMLAACRFLGVSLDGYLHPSHPFQKRIREVVSRFMGAPAAVGVDGCSAPTFAVPLRKAASGIAAFATTPGSARRVRDAMMGHPTMVGRPCASLMGAAPGALLAKAGAEGVYVLAVPGRKAGIALKVEDGNGRAWMPVLAALIRRFGLLDPAARRAVERLASPVLKNHAGLEVGSVDVTF